MQNNDYKILLLGLCFTAFAYGAENDTGVIIKPLVGRFDHSEGPVWDNDTQKLYFVDIEAQKACRFNPEDRDLACIYFANGPVGNLVPIEGEPDKLVVGTGTDFVMVSWGGTTNYTRAAPEILAIVDKNRHGTRWNDGKADTSGRYWGGTIGHEVNEVVVPDEATFYRITSNFEPKVELSPVTNSNGLAWNKEDNTFYYIDTPTLKVAAFDYEPINGTISNKRIAFDLRKNNVSGYPDGMTIDTDGNLWVALYNGGGVAHVDSRTGKVIRIIEFPVKKVTSCMFGGPLFDILYVTTSSRGLNETELAKQPLAGYVFSVTGLGAQGFKANKFRA